MSLARRLAWPLAALASLLYLGALVVQGAMPQQRQLVRFEAKGLLAEPPEAVRRIELSRGAERLVLLRRGEGWATGEGRNIGLAAARIDTALKMLRNSPPVREIAAADLAGLDAAPFGLDPPAIAVALSGADDRRLLALRFGARNPEDFLQYMRVEGDPRLFLMSRFIGAEWDEAMGAALGP
ncbi:hypothetical protein [Paracraurococcus lichenis]|uniref:DUF4340 domain-containing protein n=1 Tax=Paracraurococcus lichenis TaxID=3064888 RepID=A0ABT9DT91_9PROT|nr:hypothetical protein [Paracraurococcus sp. LOR1-02]MDO9707117.1 hypothetical protein [Paracraurococcus sp. LOR1-02]